MRTILLVLAFAGAAVGQVREGPPVKSELEIGLYVAMGSDEVQRAIHGLYDPRFRAQPLVSNARVREPEPAPAKPRTKLLYGYWFKERADGAGWDWCEECNGFPWRPGLQRKDAAPGVVATEAPFIQGTPAHGAGRASTRFPGSTPTGHTTIGVRGAGWYGGTSGCASGG
jgi:hypothetical protein